MTKQELISANSEWKNLANDLLVDFIAMVGENPTMEQQVIINRYTESIARCNKNIEELGAA